MSELYDFLIRKEVNAEYFLSVLLKYEEGEIVKPDNKNGDFTVFNQLHEMNLVVKYVVPIWNGFTLIGSEITFVYSLDMDYSFALNSN